MRVLSFVFFIMISSMSHAEGGYASFVEALETIYGGEPGGVPWGEITRAVSEFDLLTEGGVCYSGTKNDDRIEIVSDVLNVVGFATEKKLTLRRAQRPKDCPKNSHIFLRVYDGDFSEQQYKDDLQDISNIVGNSNIALYPFLEQFPGSATSFRDADKLFVYVQMSVLGGYSVHGSNRSIEEEVRSIALEEFMHTFSRAGDSYFLPQGSPGSVQSILAGTPNEAREYLRKEKVVRYHTTQSEPTGWCAVDFMIISMLSKLNDEGGVTYKNVQAKIRSQYHEYLPFSLNILEAGGGKRIFGGC